MNKEPRFICLEIEEIEVDPEEEILAFKARFLIRNSGICFYARLSLDRNGKSCDFPDNLYFSDRYSESACEIACFIAFEKKFEFHSLKEEIQEFKKEKIFTHPGHPWYFFSIQELEYIIKDMKKPDKL